MQTENGALTPAIKQVLVAIEAALTGIVDARIEAKVEDAQGVTETDVENAIEGALEAYDPSDHFSIDRLSQRVDDLEASLEEIDKGDADADRLNQLDADLQDLRGELGELKATVDRFVAAFDAFNLVLNPPVVDEKVAA